MHFSTLKMYYIKDELLEDAASLELNQQQHKSGSLYYCDHRSSYKFL